MTDATSDLDWSDWLGLAEVARNPLIPASPGLYRIRTAGTDPIVYIGQTGRTLRERLGALRGVYGDVMPYNDPHTAGPGLWALRHRDGVDFEVSVVVVDGDRVRRLGLEAVAVSTERATSGASPILNFGGMPSGYSKSTGNTARLAAAGRRRRGSPDPDSPGSLESSPPCGPLRSDPVAIDWLGLAWSPWQPPADAPPERGVYRIRKAGSDELVYVGQGQIRSRIRSHLAKSSRLGHRQSPHFAGVLEASWVPLNGGATRQLLEVENDCIASHFLVVGRPPDAQFLG